LLNVGDAYTARADSAMMRRALPGPRGLRLGAATALAGAGLASAAALRRPQLQALAPAAVAPPPAAAQPKPAEAEAKKAAKKAKEKKASAAKEKKPKKPPLDLKDASAAMFSRRCVHLVGTIDEKSATQVIEQLLYLHEADTAAPITLMLNSGGGKVVHGAAIADVMAALPNPVWTVALGHASSMAAILLAAGEPGKRYCFPSCRVMVHETSYSISKNKGSVARVAMAESLVKSDCIVELLAKHSKLSASEVRSLFDIGDRYMSAQVDLHKHLSCSCASLDLSNPAVDP